MLSLKLATFEAAKQEFGESPVLLLDDVFSELDEARQSALIERVSGAQCFITTAVPMRIRAGTTYTVSKRDDQTSIVMKKPKTQPQKRVERFFFARRRD